MNISNFVSPMGVHAVWCIYASGEEEEAETEWDVAGVSAGRSSAMAGALPVARRLVHHLEGHTSGEDGEEVALQGDGELGFGLGLEEEQGALSEFEID